MLMTLQTNILPGAVFGELERTGANRLTIEQLLTIFFVRFAAYSADMTDA